MTTNNSFQFGIRVDALESHIKSEISRIGDRAKQDMDIAVSQNLNDTSLILNSVSTETEVLKQEVNKNIDPEVDKIIEDIKQTNLEALQNATDEQVEQTNKKISSVEVDIKRTRLTYDWKKYIWVLVVIVALCSIDAGLNYSSFQVITGNLLGAIFLSIFIASGLAVASHTIGMKIQTAKTPKQKRFWFIGGLIGAGIVFLFLGILRQTYMDDSSSFGNNPILWMLFNLFFYCIALVFASTKLPTKEQSMEHRQLEEKKNQLMLLKNQKEGMLTFLRLEEERINERKQMLEAFNKYRDSMIILIDKETERIHAMAMKEFVLKSGSHKIKALVNPINQTS
jgi:hypothetical protein